MMDSNNNPTRLNHPRFRQDGVALIVVLGLMVLITVIVLAFFSRVTTHQELMDLSAGNIRAEKIARVAFGHLVDDITAEMAAGSEVVPSGDGDYFFVNNDNVNGMIPEKAVASELADNASAMSLVKQSKSGVKPFASAPPTMRRASDVNTASPDSAKNGRFIPPARWNKPQLFVSGFTLDEAQTPDWIYVTRNGKSVSSFGPAMRDRSKSNPDFVTGRYAYQIYEIGGLLDANAFGSDPGTVSTELFGAKGSPLLADLRAIPGLEGAPDVTNLLSWRDRASGAPGPGRDPEAVAMREVGGWVTPAVIYDGNEKPLDNNNFFVSRQDLIGVLKNRIGEEKAGQALPYLTHFARTLNRPSHQPIENRPKVRFTAAQGGNNASGSDNLVNPGERSRTSGRLLIKNRFALHHLGLFDDPVANASKIRDLFGLEPASSGPGWQYATSLIGANGIRRLDQITGREPNFFEVLKAAIHVGSLGVAHGSTKASDDLSAAGLSYANLFPGSVASGRDADINLHVMQIGANIIDQYDTNSFPTRIDYDGEFVSGVEAIPQFAAIMANFFAEQELLGLKPEGYDLRTPVWIGPIESVLLLQPRLWNPYVTANPGPASEVPRRFRVRAEYVGPEPFVVSGHQSSNLPDDNLWNNDRPEALAGGIYSGRNAKNFRWNYEPLGGRNFGPGQAANPGTAFARAGGSYEIEMPAGWNSTWPDPFSNPHTVFRNNYPVANIQILDPDGPVQFQTIQPGSFDGFNINLENVREMPSASYTVFGFPMGRTWQGPGVTGPTGNELLFQTAYVYGGLVVMTLSCMGPDGQWIDYDTISSNHWDWGGFVTNGSGSGGSRAATIMKTTTTGWIKFDPRTSRWGTQTALVRAMRIFQDGDDRSQFWRRNEWREGRSLMRGTTPEIEPYFQRQHEAGANPVWTVSPVVPNPTTFTDPVNPAATAFNRADTTYSYLDPDGVRRRASGAYWSSGELPGQPMASGTSEDVKINRPVMLNRPFVSVAELGFVFRDTPWRNLDFFTEESGDAALLDFFCVYPIGDDEKPDEIRKSKDGTAIIGGRVNLNTPHQKVIEALLRGVFLRPDEQPIDTNVAANLAEDFVARKAGTDVTRPFRDLSELVGYSVGGGTYGGLSRRLETFMANSNDRRIEHRREAIVRALAGTGQTRTWNFLIDLIVQNGRLVSSATSLAEFAVRGEKRYWISVAIDRHSGEVLETQWEPVYE